MAQVNLTLNGRIYRFACEDGEENHVLELGLRFDTAISELRAVFGEMGDQRLMVMAGMLMTDRLDDLERRFKRAEEDLRELKEHGLDAASRDAGLENRSVAVLQDAAMRIDSVVKLLAGPQVRQTDAR